MSSGGSSGELTSLSDKVAAVKQKNKYYTDSFARTLLKRDTIRIEREISAFVAHEIFPDIKFTVGDDDYEKELLEYAVKSGYVKLGDPRIRMGTFTDEFRPEIGKSVSALRTNAQNQVRKKYIRE